MSSPFSPPGPDAAATIFTSLYLLFFRDFFRKFPFPKSRPFFARRRWLTTPKKRTFLPVFARFGFFEKSVTAFGCNARNWLVQFFSRAQKTNPGINAHAWVASVGGPDMKFVEEKHVTRGHAEPVFFFFKSDFSQIFRKKSEIFLIFFKFLLYFLYCKMIKFNYIVLFYILGRVSRIYYFYYIYFFILYYPIFISFCYM